MVKSASVAVIVSVSPAGAALSDDVSADVAVASGSTESPPQAVRKAMVIARAAAPRASGTNMRPPQDEAAVVSATSLHQWVTVLSSSRFTGCRNSLRYALIDGGPAWA